MWSVLSMDIQLDIHPLPSLTDCEAVLYDLIKEPQMQRVARPTLLHADLHKRNIFVFDSEPSKITGIIDWQSTSIEHALIYANDTRRSKKTSSCAPKPSKCG
jgi:serine/threonine-protein kinase RIO1